jgi:hypothetical protein
MNADGRTYLKLVKPKLTKIGKLQRTTVLYLWQWIRQPFHQNQHVVGFEKQPGDKERSIVYRQNDFETFQKRPFPARIENNCKES